MSKAATGFNAFEDPQFADSVQDTLTLFTNADLEANKYLPAYIVEVLARWGRWQHRGRAPALCFEAACLGGASYLAKVNKKPNEITGRVDAFLAKILAGMVIDEVEPMARAQGGAVREKAVAIVADEFLARTAYPQVANLAKKRMKRLKTTARISGGSFKEEKMDDPRRPSLTEDKRKDESNFNSSKASSRGRQASTPDLYITPSKFSGRGSDADSRMGKSEPNLQNPNPEYIYQESGYRMHQSTQELRPNPNDYYRFDQRPRGAFAPAGLIPPRKHIPENEPGLVSANRSEYQRRASNERNVFDQSQHQRRPSNEREIYEANYNRRPSNDQRDIFERRGSNERIIGYEGNQRRRPSNEYQRPERLEQNTRRPSVDETRQPNSVGSPRQPKKPAPKKVSGMLDSVLADYERFISKRK